jgi:hypothetical protein
MNPWTQPSSSGPRQHSIACASSSPAPRTARLDRQPELPDDLLAAGAPLEVADAHRAVLGADDAGVPDLEHPDAELGEFA